MEVIRLHPALHGVPLTSLFLQGTNQGEPDFRDFGDNRSSPADSPLPSQNEFQPPEPNAEKALNNCNK